VKLKLIFKNNKVEVDAKKEKKEKLRKEKGKGKLVEKDK